MACRASLPVKLEYWPTSVTDCGKLPDFDAFPEPQSEKKISQMRFDTKDQEEGNIFGVQTDKTYATRLTSYFFVREKGTYKVFMLLGHRDTGIGLFIIFTNLFSIYSFGLNRFRNHSVLCFFCHIVFKGDFGRAYRRVCRVYRRG